MRIIDAKHCPHCKARLPQPVPRTCPECAGSLQQRFLASGCLTTKPPAIAFLLAGGLALAARGGDASAATTAAEPSAARAELETQARPSAGDDTPPAPRDDSLTSSTR